MNLPAPVGNPDNYGVTDNQVDDPNMGINAQILTMKANFAALEQLADGDVTNGLLTPAQKNVISERKDYQDQEPVPHYDTILLDLLFYLASEGVQNSEAYTFAQQMLADANNRRSSGMGAIQPINPVGLVPGNASPRQKVKTK
jgi:hypothetical protein